jgi:hypothetical protein
MMARGSRSIQAPGKRQDAAGTIWARRRRMPIVH